MNRQVISAGSEVLRALLKNNCFLSLTADFKRNKELHRINDYKIINECFFLYQQKTQPAYKKSFRWLRKGRDSPAPTMPAHLSEQPFLCCVSCQLSSFAHLSASASRTLSSPFWSSLSFLFMDLNLKSISHLSLRRTGRFPFSLMTGSRKPLRLSLMKMKSITDIERESPSLHLRSNAFSGRIVTGTYLQLFIH